METLGACDLMIDTLGWSGGNSALDALRMGLADRHLRRANSCAVGNAPRCCACSASRAPRRRRRGRWPNWRWQRIGDDGFRQAFRSRVDAGT
jgi:hypothetical protein